MLHSYQLDIVRFRFFPKRAVWLAGILLLALTPGADAVSGTNQISAANIVVVQNDTSNNATSVTLSTPVSINDFRVISGTQSSRADYFVQIGASATDDVTNGILISCIDQNGRETAKPACITALIMGQAQSTVARRLRRVRAASGGFRFFRRRKMGNIISTSPLVFSVCGRLAWRLARQFNGCQRWREQSSHRQPGVAARHACYRFRRWPDDCRFALVRPGLAQ